MQFVNTFLVAWFGLHRSACKIHLYLHFECQFSFWVSVAWKIWTLNNFYFFFGPLQKEEKSGHVSSIFLISFFLFAKGFQYISLKHVFSILIIYTGPRSVGKEIFKVVAHHPNYYFVALYCTINL